MSLANELTIAEILRRTKTIAVVGLSQNRFRASNRVADYMQSEGYRIVPVNPRYTSILSEICYPDLLQIPASISIDMVNIFRKVEAIPAIVEQAIQRGVQGVWMQEGLVHEEAAKRANQAGLWVVMNRCVMIEHQHASSSFQT
ncbi:MAG: CoA-binding protein [Terriglobia bacterium]